MCELTIKNRNNRPEGTGILQEEKMALDPKSQNSESESVWRKLWTFPVISNIILGPSIVILIFALSFGALPSTKLGFSCQDPSLSYPYRGDTVTNTGVLLGSLLTPLLLICLTELIREGSYKKIRVSTIWFFFKEVAVKTWGVAFLAEISKVIFVEHRPHFFATCQPDKNFNCTPGTYIEEYICTNTLSSPDVIAMASRSFPSSHTVMGTCSAVFCVYILQTRLPSAVTGSILKLTLKALCLGWGFYCSLTRITDRRHHWWDVLFGGFMGSFCTIYFLVIFHKKARKHLDELHAPSIPQLVPVRKSSDDTKDNQV